MVLSQKREKFKKIETKTGEFFSRFPLSPNCYTLISVILAFVSFYFLIKIKLPQAFVIFVLASLFDFIDGAVARYSQRATKTGAYLDTICDRYVEGIILLGFLFLPLPTLLLPPQVWVFLVLLGGLMTTYSKAAAKEKELTNLEFKKGLLGRGERIILLSFSIIIGIFNFYWMSLAIIILAFLFNIAALERIFLVITQTKENKF